MEKQETRGLYIDIFNLQNKSYDFDFEVDDQFFQSFDDSLVNKGKVNIKVSLNKSETFIEINMQFKGAIELVCDRSLEKFEYPVTLNPNLIFKFGDEEKELDDFMMQITRDTLRIELAQYIYEFISLAIPMKKLHPRFADLDEDGDGLVYSSAEADDDADKSDQGAEENVDPRWKKLIELKNTKQ